MTLVLFAGVLLLLPVHYHPALLRWAGTASACARCGGPLRIVAEEVDDGAGWILGERIYGRSICSGTVH